MAVLTQKTIGIVLLVELIVLSVFITFLYVRHRIAFQTCHFFNPNQTLKSNVVLLYGATSFLGSKAALALLLPRVK